MMMKLLLNQDPAAGGGGAVADWTAGFPDDAKPVIQAKGWKTPQDMFGSYRNLEKVLGNNIEKPQPTWDDKKWEEFYKAGGRPETPDKYELKDAQELLKKAPVPVDEAKLNKWKAELHKQGLSERQANAILKTYLDDEFGAVSASEQAAKNEREQSEMKLRNEWGGKFDDNVKLARTALEKLEVGPEFKQFLETSKLGNHPEMVKLLHSIGTKIMEDNANGGGNQNLGTTPESAQAEITKLKGDKEFQALFMKGDKASMDKWNQLHAAAYPKPAQ